MQTLKLPGHKTKIVCTISPASRPASVLEELMGQGIGKLLYESLYRARRQLHDSRR